MQRYKIVANFAKISYVLRSQGFCDCGRNLQGLFAKVVWNVTKLDVGLEFVPQVFEDGAVDDNQFLVDVDDLVLDLKVQIVRLALDEEGVFREHPQISVSDMIKNPAIKVDSVKESTLVVMETKSLTSRTTCSRSWPIRTATACKAR